MKKVVLSIMFVVLALLLSGCGPRIDSGIVRDKSHRSAWIQIICTRPGNVTICNPITHPESWRLDIWEGGEDDPHGWVSVNEAMYDMYEVGDHWERPYDASQE